MPKEITKLNRNPFAVSLESRPTVVYVSEPTGVILYDSDIASVVCDIKKNPKFLVSNDILELHYCGIRFMVGHYSDAEELASWANDANTVLDSYNQRNTDEV